MHSVEFKLQKMFVYPFLVTNCQITTLLKAERMLTKVTVVARFKLKSRNLSRFKPVAYLGSADIRCPVSDQSTAVY